jgi:hypothetical protein
MQALYVFVRPSREPGIPFRMTYTATGLHGGSPTRSFESWAGVDEHLRSLGFSEFAIQTAEREVNDEKEHVLQRDWRDEFESIWST